MLMGIIGPQWSTVTEEAFLETLEAWEVMICRRYEEQSGEEVTGATRCAVVMRHAPTGIRTALRTASSTIGTNFELLRKCVKDYLQTGQTYDNKGQASKDAGGAAPMDVGSLTLKGKGDHKGYKGLGKWVPKGGKKGKEPDKGKGGKKGSFSKGKFDKAKHFEGYCSYCYKWGHKKADCRAREKDRAGKGKGSVNSATLQNADAGDSPKSGVAGAVSYVVDTQGLGEISPISEPDWLRSITPSPERPAAASHSEEPVLRVTSEVKRVPRRAKDEDRAPARIAEEQSSGKRARWGDSIDSDEESEGWVAAVGDGRQHGGQDQYVMYDTGSDEHVCTEAFARAVGPLRPSLLNLRAVSGEALNILGEATMILTLMGVNGQAVQVETIFQVSRNATKNILSGGKLYKAGFLAVIKPGEKTFLWHEGSETEIPLHMRGNTFYLKLARKAEHGSTCGPQVRIVAPVAQESPQDQWENAGLEDHIEEASDEGIELPDLRGEGFGLPVMFDASSTMECLEEQGRTTGSVEESRERETQVGEEETGSPR